MLRGVSGLVLVLLLTAGPVVASDDIDQHEVQVLREQGVIIPLEDVLKNVQKTRPGRVMEVELERKHSRYIYEIEIADDNGRVWELEIAASDGSLISQEQDD